ncbi:MAG: zinc-dependent metalloprotease [Proteobacteria bacterium]|nr:zinc-dependent metalloprotease [Pseudomonadota bacterium]
MNIVNSASKPACLTLVFGSLLASACVEDFDDEAAQEIVDNLRLAGYPDSEIAVHDGTVVVGGDAEVSLQASREMVGIWEGNDRQRGKEDQFKQYRTTNLVASSVRTICIEAEAFRKSKTLKRGLNNAIANYNRENLIFEMRWIRKRSAGDGCDAYIVGMVGAGSGGRAGFPSHGYPFGNFIIGRDVTRYGTAATTHLITHELGHCIGLRHTDYFNRSISCGEGGDEGPRDVGAVHIPNTPTGAVRDGSVMNACYHRHSTGQWTSSDIVALNQLYGL